MMTQSIRSNNSPQLARNVQTGYADSNMATTRDRLLSEPSVFDKLRGLADEQHESSAATQTSGHSAGNAHETKDYKPSKPSVFPGFLWTKPSAFPTPSTPFPIPFPTIPGGWQLEVELADPGLTDAHDELNNNEFSHDDIVYQDIDGEVYVDGVELTDVTQGAVGDCYFMAALASVAQHNPEYLEQMITDNGNGTYTVHFGGDLGDVIVDDDFAVNSAGNAVYAGTDSNGDTELWVAIIEKAYAQSEGSYESIEGGHAHHAIGVLTGQTNFSTGHPSQFEPENLQAALANGQSVTASSLSSNNGKKDETEFGIVTQHAYVVTDVHQNADGQWMVTVYNPWGNDGRGPDAITGADDGFIEMTYEEFSNNFRDVQVSNQPVG